MFVIIEYNICWKEHCYMLVTQGGKQYLLEVKLGIWIYLKQQETVK